MALVEDANLMLSWRSDQQVHSPALDDDCEIRAIMAGLAGKRTVSRSIQTPRQAVPASRLRVGKHNIGLRPKTGTSQSVLGRDFGPAPVWIWVVDATRPTTLWRRAQHAYQLQRSILSASVQKTTTWYDMTSTTLANRDIPTARLSRSWLSDAMMRNGTSTQTAFEIVEENIWFPTLFNHSVFGVQTTAKKVWQALTGWVSRRSGMEANSLGCLRQSTNPNIIKTDGLNNAGFVEPQWVNWQVPTLIDTPASTSAAAASTTSAASTSAATSTVASCTTVQLPPAAVPTVGTLNIADLYQLVNTPEAEASSESRLGRHGQLRLKKTGPWFVGLEVIHQ
ncbi:hypothetical protein BDZ89DRAFT_1054220 [Hymenopellis radicata]|nr:hypothetical protein BDZ89DRAFT_1054220 [Hymenopellis radicata]